MWVQDSYKKGIPVDTNMIQGKRKSLYDNFKQKEGKRSKSGEFNVSRGWFDNFRKRLGFKNIKIRGEADSANQVAAEIFELLNHMICQNRILTILFFITYSKNGTVRSISSLCSHLNGIYV